MFNLDDVKRIVDKYTYEDAININTRRSIYDFDYDESNYPLIKIYGSYISSYDYYNYRITIDDVKKEIIRSEYQERWGNFKKGITPEICASLIGFIKARESGEIELINSYGIATSSNILRYINNDNINVDKSGSIHLNVYITDCEDNKLVVYFTIGRNKSTTFYVVKRIDTLCEAITNKQYLKYGGKLGFVPSIDSFDNISKKIIMFIMSIYNDDDSYSNYYNYYYDYYRHQQHNTIDKQLHLSGRYLDEFLSFVEEGMTLHYGERKDYTILHYSTDLYNIKSKIERYMEGYTFTIKNTQFCIGGKYIYILDINKKYLYRQDKNDDLVSLLKMANKLDNNVAFVSDGDIYKFTKNIYSKLKKYSNTICKDYNPELYAPKTPKYELYLDMPTNNTVTGKLMGVYDDLKYDLLKDKNLDLDKRNEEDELEKITIVDQYFNGIVENKNIFYIDDDDELYEFINSGIPSLQTIFTVYISDKLKNIKINKMSSIQVGVSLSNDLLQLNLSTDDRTLQDLAEILNKYEQKKKYYRLKNGNYINVENSDIDSLATLFSDLQVSNKDIKQGNINLPKYRALYLDNEDYVDINYDDHFRKLIENVQNIDKQEYIIPPSLDDTLRNYQKEGYRWLSTLKENGFGALLADEMGLGKSIQIISLILSLENRGRVLIVCPASLVYNWQNEFYKFAPHIPVVALSGNANERLMAINNSANNCVFISSYDCLKKDIDLHLNFDYDVEIIDEAQYIKNTNTLASSSVKEIKAKFKVALTGTPIENKLSELWSIFDYLMPGFLYSYNRFKKMFENEIIRNNNKQALDKLKLMVSPFILRRLKKDVLSDLPDKLEEILTASLEGEQKQLYEARKQRLKLSLEKTSEKEFKNKKIEILAELTRLRQLCCSPGLVYDQYKGNSNKEDMCIDLIKTAVDEGHKVLLFSQFTSMIHDLVNKLDEENISYYILEGKTPKTTRAQLVESFQNDNTNVFCISLKAGGTGLNLTAADIVIHYDPWWNTAVENQATDRAHRIGQNKVVTVYRLIMKDTIEERIIELQNTKADLANELLSGEDISSSKLSKEQLLAIL